MNQKKVATTMSDEWTYVSCDEALKTEVHRLLGNAVQECFVLARRSGAEDRCLIGELMLLWAQAIAMHAQPLRGNNDDATSEPAN